jgi:hypothetical protein
MDIGLRHIFNLGPVRKPVTDEIQGIDPVIPGKDFNLFFPYPESSAKTVNQYEGFPFPFYGIKDGVVLNLNGLRE